MKKVILFLLMFSVGAFAQTWLFENSAGDIVDSTSVDSGTAVTTVVVDFNSYPEGVATLFCWGDTVSSTPMGVVGEYRIWYGMDEAGDSLFGEWTALTDSVLEDGHFDGREYDSGTLIGNETDLGNVWNLGEGVLFRFTPHFTGYFIAKLLFY